MEGMSGARRLLAEERARVMWLAARLVKNRVLEMPAGESQADWFMHSADSTDLTGPDQGAHDNRGS